MSVSTTAASYCVKTCMGIKSELFSYVDVPFTADTEMTLNYKYNVFANLTPTVAPKVRYFSWGSSGYYSIDDEQLLQPYIPKETNADLYNPLPFRCVPLNEDLSADERKLYRMRVKQTFNGVAYWCYYLKVIEIIDSSVKVTQTDPNNANEEIEYIMDPANLYPTPSKPTTSGTITGTVNEINVSVTGLLTLTGAEVLEVVGVVFNGDLRRANYSEIGICGGEDRILQGYDYQSAPFNYTEAVYAHLCAHRCSTPVLLDTANSQSSLYLKIGSGSIMLL